MVNYTENELFSITEDVAITPLTFINSDGAVTSCSVSPTLPNGLSVSVDTAEYARLKQIEEDVKKDNWLKENKKAIDGQNERIEKHGSFSDEHRRF